MLRFLGRGSAFADEQNCAYTVYNDTLILLDCPMSAFHKLRRAAVMQTVSRIDILVTHTHSDHIGGIPMLIHFAYYVLHKPVRVIVPNADMQKNLEYLIKTLDGCAEDAYDVVTADQNTAGWLIAAIPTKHDEVRLAGRCFGWHLRFSDTDVIFTGDTKTLDPFLPLLHPGAYFYTEASVFKSNVHLYLDDVLPLFQKLCEEGVHVYLMHLDDETAVFGKIQDTGIQLAPLVP